MDTHEPAHGFPDMTLEGLKLGTREGLGTLFLVPTTFYNPAEEEFEYGHLEVRVDRRALSVKAVRR